MANDIIDAIMDRFNDFNMYFQHFDESGYDFHIIYNTYHHDKYVGEIIFYDTFLTFRYTNFIDNYFTVCYDDLDIDVLVGLFLCEVYYGS